ncbi:hypothetical protein C2S52_021804 [Perilla frutescens var. hirtella]|nr:hypothetical protein C2S52_021804 [Perilla frutescens var. hirtella]KAH6807708.1 hypothetical protein C2S51_028816 [Perilla frutescens var. frutescens]
MVRVSNWLITALNVVTLAVALSALCFSLWFHVRSGSQCERVVKTPLMVVSALLLVVSVAGLVGALSGVSLIMWLYLFLLFLLILGLIIFTIFTVMVTNKGLGQAISGQGVGDHRLGNYSKWLQKYVVNARNWDKIKSCMADAHLCFMVNDSYKQINPIVSGCCKPPVSCGFKSKNATYWVMPKTGRAVSDPDCKAWSNKQDEMCLDCDSCKKAVLENIRREWKLLALINICIIVIVVVVYSIGCCALRNNRYHHHNNNCAANDNNKHHHPNP